MKAKSLKTKVHSRTKQKNIESILVECSISQLSYIDALLVNSIISIKEVDEINQKLNGFVSEGEAEELINYLLENQKCLIDSGSNYQQRDIINKLKKFC